MSQNHLIPLAAKLAYTLFVVVLVPYYWMTYSAWNFLFFCDLALLVGLGAFWLESPLLLSLAAVGITVPQAAVGGRSLDRRTNHGHDQLHVRLQAAALRPRPFFISRLATVCPDLGSLAARIRPARLRRLDGRQHRGSAHLVLSGPEAAGSC